jgi:hypothetical protein
MYERIEEALQEYGELMIRLDSGEEAELHLHNTEFLEDSVIKVDADDEVHWFNAEKVERYWIHYDF